MASVSHLRLLCLGLIGVAAACSSGAAVPTVTQHLPPNAIDTPADVAAALNRECPGNSARVRLDLVQGDIHLRRTFSCALVGNATAAEADLVDLVAHRHNATQRADRLIRFKKAFNVKFGRDRAGAIWMLGTGFEGLSCTRAGDSAFHRREMAVVTPAGIDRESPTRWTEIEAAYIAGVCPDRLPIFFSSVARAGQPAAAKVVRTEVQSLGVGS
jgi:hypothetical protein